MDDAILVLAESGERVRREILAALVRTDYWRSVRQLMVRLLILWAALCWLFLWWLRPQHDAIAAILILIWPVPTGLGLAAAFLERQWLRRAEVRSSEHYGS